jgi:predicted transcriptional regulator of viral defense system
LSQVDDRLRLVLTEADRRIAVRASLCDGIFTLADAQDAGLSRDQIRERVARDWIACHEGVFRIAGAPDSWRGRLRAAVAAAAPYGVISHRSAAALYDLPGRRTDVVELTCRRWLRARHPGIIVHESRLLDAADVSSIDEIAATSPERTIVDLASLFPSPNFLETVVHAARRKRLITYESTSATFSRHAKRGRRGVRALRATLDLWNPEARATESEMETLLVQALRTHGFSDLVTQFEVLDDRGLFVARVDAALPESRITIEYDSKQEHSDEFQLARDAARRNRIVAAGYAHLVARHRDLLAGGGDLAAAIAATQLNRRRTVG